MANDQIYRENINPRLQRWLINLGEYNFTIDYIKGKNNFISDFLSRIKDDEINHWEDEENTGEDIEIEQPDCENSIHDEHENASIEVQTVHSQEEDLGYNIPILETVVNRFKVQIILIKEKRETVTTIFGKKRIFIERSDITNGYVIDILRREVTKGKIGIYSYLSDHEYYQVYRILENEYSANPHVKFVKCTKKARDIESEDELKTQIALFHKNESGHCGITATYEKLKMIIYNPDLKTQIFKIINNCEICTAGKYDRNPIKNKFRFTEIPLNINEMLLTHM